MTPEDTDSQESRQGPRGELQFDAMGESYIQSLSTYPDARNEEWNLIEEFVMERPESILDYACGNGFVTDRILKCLDEPMIVGVDSSPVMLTSYEERFSKYASVTAMTPRSFSRIDRKFDLTVSLGGFHHVLDQVETLCRIRDATNANGKIIFADFQDCSASQRYFDTLINDFNPVGHVGLFVSESRASNLARACDLSLIEYRSEKVAWKFLNENEMLQFVKIHHGLLCELEQIRMILKREGMTRSVSDGVCLEHDYAVFIFST